MQLPLYCVVGVALENFVVPEYGKEERRDDEGENAAFCNQSGESISCNIFTREQCLVLKFF